MTNSANTTASPSLDMIIGAVGGQLSRDGESVVVSYGRNGFVRLVPNEVILNGEPRPAATITAEVRGRRGGIRSDIADKLRAAGIYPC
jgi:hypothetical protein